MIVIEGRIFYNGSLTQGAVGIEDGKITDVKKVLRGDRNIDLGDRIILPGAVDPHVHFRDPGMTGKEDFVSGSTAALYGGVTCVLDMPNTKPPVTDARSLDDKKRTIKGRSFVDYGLFAALTKGCDVLSMAAKVAGFKLFMGSTTGDLLMNDPSDVHWSITAAARTGKRISIHAEDDSMIHRNEEKNNRDHLRNRPVSAEHNAISRLSPYKGMKVNICHITDAHSAALASSFGFTTEVTAHHLLFDDSVSDSGEYKVNPPLRDRKTKDALYKAFIDDKITMFGSDHAPHTIDEKQRIYNDAPSGIPGVETYVPMMMDMVKRGKITVQHLVKMSSAAPSQAFGIKKGMIKKGYDADIAVYDMRLSKRIRARELHSKASYTPYEGRDAIFPDMVIVNGNIQLKDGELCGDMTGRDMFE
ncbi:MAG: dihydroorotase [Methanomassiliicoccaceae archaeon]|jgi:dihydroorotase|nr:dihydroorotase [Methanomassiliicoccaceae archaeon]